MRAYLGARGAPARASAYPLSRPCIDHLHPTHAPPGHVNAPCSVMTSRGVQQNPAKYGIDSTSQVSSVNKIAPIRHSDMVNSSVIAPIRHSDMVNSSVPLSRRLLSCSFWRTCEHAILPLSTRRTLGSEHEQSAMRVAHGGAATAAETRGGRGWAGRTRHEGLASAQRPRGAASQQRDAPR